MGGGVPQGIIEWLAPEYPEEVITIKPDNAYEFIAYLPTPYRYQIGKKYYCWIVNQEENREKVISNTMAFKVSLNHQSVDKIMDLSENKSENYLKANLLNPKHIYYALRGKEIHRNEHINEEDWRVAYEKSALGFKEWWEKNKNSAAVLEIMKTINEGGI